MTYKEAVKKLRLKMLMTQEELWLINLNRQLVMICM